MTGTFMRRIRLAVQAFRRGDQTQALRKELRITTSDLESIQAFFPMPKFFIFGHARSGTTLLARLIRLHPEVHCNWQAHFFTRRPVLQALAASPEIRDWLEADSNRWNQGEQITPLLLRAAADLMMERQAVDLGKSIVGDKSPNSQLKGQAVQLLHDIYPDGRLIFIVRDGRDVVVSHRFQAFIDFPEFLSRADLEIRDDFADSAEPFYRGGRSIFTRDWLLRDIRSWRENLQETKAAGERLFGHQFRVVKYEDLISHPEKMLRELWAFIGVEHAGLPESSVIEKELSQNPDKAWQKKQSKEIVSNLEKGKAGSWKDLFVERDKQLVKKQAGQTLIDWGYEKDLEW